VGHSGDLKSYWGIIGGGLLTGEACSTAIIILKIGHVLLQKWQIVIQGETLATDNMEWANIILLSQFPYPKNLPYINDTAHNIIQLNQQTVYGSEVALCIWPIGWSSGLVFRYCYCNNCLYCLEGDFYAEFADCVTCIKNGRSAKTKIIMLGLSDP